jgi:hypothetical protein
MSRQPEHGTTTERLIAHYAERVEVHGDGARAEKEVATAFWMRELGVSQAVARRIADGQGQDALSQFLLDSGAAEEDHLVILRFAIDLFSGRGRP